MVRGPLQWMSDNPLRTAGFVGAIVAVLYVVVASATAESAGTTMTVSGVSAAAVVSFALAHPAYPVVAAVGLGAFLFLD